jgi:hypothetical protein
VLAFRPELVPREVMEFIRYGAIAGFIASTAFVINLNWITFSFLFQEKTKTFWILFAFAAVLIFLILLYIFSMVFEKVMLFGLI